MREESGKTHETPFQASDQALDEDLVLELGLRGGGLRLAVEVVEHVARHEEDEAGQYDGAEEEHLHERVSSNFMALVALLASIKLKSSSVLQYQVMEPNHLAVRVFDRDCRLQGVEGARKARAAPEASSPPKLLPKRFLQFNSPLPLMPQKPASSNVSFSPQKPGR